MEENPGNHNGVCILLSQFYSICIRTVSSQRLLSTLHNWFILVYGQFGQSNSYHTFNFCPRSVRKDSNVPLLKISQELTVLIYITILCTLSRIALLFLFATEFFFLFLKSWSHFLSIPQKECLIFQRISKQPKLPTPRILIFLWNS